MKAIYTLVSIVAACTLLTAQKAPDFTITDYNGEVHKLYDDYLDEGKVVMLKIMFVACPPCNLAAPSVQDLYEEFGEGQEDVEFFDLSNKSWDTNSAMEGFADKHDLTFTGAGVDGGALTAVDPYVSGEFGRFRGTPTFIVIDREGNVNFDVSLSLLKSAIEDALDNTGGCSNSFSGQISGPEDNVTVSLKSDIQGAQTFVVNPTGETEYEYACEFTFPPQADDYYIDVEKDGEDLNGVSTKDIVFIVRHLLGIETFETTEEKIAADFSANDVVSARDISQMRKLILGITSENEDHDSWRFWSVETDFSNDTTGILIPDLIEQVPLMDVVDSMMSGDFNGVKLGDVSGDINEFFGEPNKTRGQVEFSFQDHYVQEGDYVQLSIPAETDMDISGIQFSLEISGDNVEIDLPYGLESFRHFSSTRTNIMAYTPSSVSLLKSEPIIEMRFVASRSGMISDLLHLNSTSTPALLMFADNDEVPFRLIAEDEKSGLVVTPNPFQSFIRVDSDRPIQSIDLYNSAGQMLKSWNDPGDGSTRLNMTDFTSGIYYLHVVREDRTYVEQLIRQ